VRDDLTRKAEDYVQSIAQLRESEQFLHSRIVEMEGGAEASAAKIQDLTDQIATRVAEHEREQRRKLRLEKELKDLKEALERKQKEQQNLNLEITAQQDVTKKLELQLKEQKHAYEKSVREYDALFGKSQKLIEDLDEQMRHNTQTMGEIAQAEARVRTREDDIAKLRADNAQLVRRVEKERKAQTALRNKLGDARLVKEALQAELASVRKDLDLCHVVEEADKKRIDEISREKEIAQKACVREAQRLKASADLLKVHQLTAKTLENDIHALVQESAKSRKSVYQLEKDKEKYGVEASEAHTKFLHAMEEMKLKEMQIVELHKAKAEADAKLKMQQQLYEQVRGDRNLYSKNLIERQDEIAEMKRKFKIMNHQIEQLKEEISAKDRALVLEHFDHQKVEKVGDKLALEVDKMKKQLEANAATIESQNLELTKLTQMISSMDAEALRQRNEYDQVINERDILGTQLIRRNDELALLYEKIKIQHSTLRKGEVQYQDRLSNIRTLKLRIADMKREMHIAKNQVNHLDDLKREVYHLQRELLQEKTKVKALSEELENPMNVHRWRKLEGSDPATYEMIQKIQTLQKRLIAKTEEAVEKDLKIQEQEKLSAELKNILARQPGPEVAEQLAVYQQNLKEKTRQMKAMASELNMYQAQVTEYKYEIERLSRELADVKRKFFEQKRREQLQREAAAAATSKAASRDPALAQAAAAQQASARFTGGGFNLQV
jgi:chromosome segregation ATPase